MSDFDSDEEEWFSWYCDELVEQGLALSWSRARTFELLPAERRVFHGARKKETEKDFMLGHGYTPDFEIKWAPEAIGLLTQDWKNPRIDDRIPFIHNQYGPVHDEPDREPFSVIEVKPFFDRHGKTAWAACQIKWTLQKYQIFCQLFKVGGKPKGIFDSTFTPDRFLITPKTKKPRSISFKPATVVEFIHKRVQQQHWDARTAGLPPKELAAVIKAGNYAGAIYVP